MRLYEMSEQYNDLLDMLQNDMENEQLAIMLEGMEGKIEEKIENTVKVMKSLESEGSAIDAEIQRLMKRKAVLGNNVQNLKNNVEMTMRNLNIEQVKGTLHTIGFKKNPPKLNVIRESAIPYEYYNEPVVEPKLDRKKLLDAMKNGLLIDGVEIVQETSLTIK